jgi:hypothetical protein
MPGPHFDPEDFDRYNYDIKASYMDDENLNSFYQNRL